MPTFADASGHGRSGVLLGAVSHLAGPAVGSALGAAQQALFFNALGWLNRTATMAALPLNPPYTIEYWVQPTPDVKGWMNPIGWNAADDISYIAADFYADGVYTDEVEIYCNRGLYGQTSPPLTDLAGLGPAQDERWHYLVLTSSGAAGETPFAFYLDGAPLGPLYVGGGGRAAQGDVTGYVCLGDGPFAEGWGEPVQGGLAHVAVYPTVLSAAQVLAHYNAAGSYNLDATLAGAGVRERDRAQPLSAALTPVGVRGRDYPHTAAATLTPAGSRSHVLAPWAFTRGTFIQPQHAPRTLVTPEGASPLRALPVGDTTATDAVLAPDDANIAYYLDWSNTLPAGFGISSISAQALIRPDAATAWSAATDVTSTFVNATSQLGMQTRVIVADGNQTLGQQYRVRLLATFSNSPATILEAFFDLTVAET